MAQLQPTNDTNPLPPVPVSTNRLSDQFDPRRTSPLSTDPVIQALENAPDFKRGSYSRPSIMRFPSNISSGEFPHLMQFRVFWRWERKDLEPLNQARRDTESKLTTLKEVESILASSGNEKSLSDVLSIHRDFVNNFDPQLYAELSRNPKQAKELLEQRIKSEQTSLEELNTFGKVSLDNDERLQVQDRLTNAVENLSAVESGVAAGIAAGVLGYFTGGAKGAAIGLGSGALAGGGAVLGAQFAQNQPVYDQMVSIYLPFCTKVNNEDSFVFEDSSQTKAKGFADLFSASGSMLDAGSQVLDAGAQQVAGQFGDAIASTTGRVLNPRLEKLFKQKDFRNFTFSWELYARNEDEVRTIRDVVESFRYHAHPAKAEEVNMQEGEQTSNTQIMLRVPAEFEVRFLSYESNERGSEFKENPFLPKIGRCVISSISVDYTPNAVFSSFKNNSPTSVTLTISMSEVTTITRETVDLGY
jgi:hypothetical protein